jgi:hypothetical protein
MKVETQSMTSTPIEEEPHVLPETTKISRSPQPFFVDVCGYDKHLWRELEYVISDMNCYSTHMMQYMLAKMLIATERLLEGVYKYILYIRIYYTNTYSKYLYAYIHTYIFYSHYIYLASTRVKLELK